MMEGIIDNTEHSEFDAGSAGKRGALRAESPEYATSFEEVAGLSPVSPLAINETQLRYWQLTGYSSGDLLRVAQKLDSKEMFIIASFDGSGKAAARVSGRTWERQEGHYPTILNACAALAANPILQGARGEIFIWLEDGLWDWQQKLTESVPVFAFGRHVHDTKTLLMPDPAYLESLGYAEEVAGLVGMAEHLPWRSRKDTVFFRGAASGLGFYAGAWQQSARGRLVLEAKKIAQPGVLDAKITRFSHLDDACRSELLGAGVVDVEVPLDTFCSYKYLVDADGHCCAWKSLFLKMAMGSVVLKIDSPYQQWYHHRLKPWKHYVPLAADLSNFESVYAWLREHEDCAEEIARNGQKFVQGLLFSDALNEMAVYIKQLFTSQRG
jgi:hypothetical protein